jgi:hypothetical protein
MMELVELLKEHTRKIPCFCCLVRPVCCKYNDRGHIVTDVSGSCIEIINWKKGRDEIIGDSLSNKEIDELNRVIASIITEFRETERKNNGMG